HSLFLSHLSSSLHSFIYLFSPIAVPSTTYSLSLHDALPILIFLLTFPYIPSPLKEIFLQFLLKTYLFYLNVIPYHFLILVLLILDRKSTRLNSSHVSISYAVFGLIK